MHALHLHAAWLGILLGMASGAVLGLLFHREGFLGGYGSWSRRLARLGHISFFGIAFLNLAFAATPVAAPWAGYASPALLAGAVLMPTICFLAAWRSSFRHLFFAPVLALLGGALFTLGGI